MWEQERENMILILTLDTHWYERLCSATVRARLVITIPSPKMDWYFSYKVDDYLMGDEKRESRFYLDSSSTG